MKSNCVQAHSILIEHKFDHSNHPCSGPGTQLRQRRKKPNKTFRKIRSEYCHDLQSPHSRAARRLLVAMISPRDSAGGVIANCFRSESLCPDLSNRRLPYIRQSVPNRVVLRDDTPSIETLPSRCASRIQRFSSFASEKAQQPSGFVSSRSCGDSQPTILPP